MAHHASPVIHYPGESKIKRAPSNGSVVCCGIYGVFEHTGIWVDGDIVELRGNGLIRGISTERFLHDRSGNQIFVLCNQDFQPLCHHETAERAISRLFEYSEYDVLTNNCHRFVWQCVSGELARITSFYDLNQLLSRFYRSHLSWCPIS